MSDRAIQAARERLAERNGPVEAATIDPAAQRGAPTKEEGAPGVVTGMGGLGRSIFGGPGIMGRPDWAYFVDTREYAPELQWPASIPILERMETDAQLKGLLLATTLPIRRFRWEIDPNEADPEVVDHAAEDLNLPIRGEDPNPRRGGVNHDTHMAHALRALSQGHYHFEELVELRDDGLLHLVKLGTRPPRSIIGIRTDEHGNLEAIEQMPGGFGTGGRILGGVGAMGIRTLEASRLLTYVWDSRDDGDQVGSSMLRPTYRNWLVKDALIRVDAVKHERNAMGIPWFEVDPAASQAQIDGLAQKAEEIRASAVGGGAGPGKLGIKGVEGTLPDTIGSIRYHDEQMSKAMMLLLFNLGGDARTGARALGETFVDTYLEMQAAIADWYVERTQALIDRQVERNWGPDERAPLLAYTRIETAALAFKDLAEGVDKGLIAVDEELRAYIGERWKLPGQDGPISAPPAPAPPPPVPPAPEAPPAASEVGDGLPGPQPLAVHSPSPSSSKRPQRSVLANKLAEVVTAPMTWPEAARLAGSDPKNGTARRARDHLLAEGAILKRSDGTLAPVVALELPERDLKRAPLAFEVTAQVNFATMEETFEQGRTTLVDAYRAAQDAQIEQLVAEVEAAEGDAATLATLTCDPVDTEVLAGPLLAVAEAGIVSAEAEHDAQVGVNAKAPFEGAEVDDAALTGYVNERAEAAALTLSSGLAGSASKKAAAVSSLDPSAAATVVRDHLTSLTDAALTEQLGGATQQAYNGGRRAYMRAAAPKEIYASEILDGNACANCNGMDGTEWSTLAEAEVAYPIGGYVECEGGLRCRGTLVAVY